MVMAADRALTIGDIGITGVRDLVRQVGKECAGGDKVRELRIVGHGSENGQYFGRDWIDDISVDAYAMEWLTLKSYFDRSVGLLTLGGCKVGQAELLLVKLSHYLGVPARGFRTFQNPIIPGDEGGETRCTYYGCERTTKDYTVYDEASKNAFNW